MKKYLVILMLVLVAMILTILPGAMAEAVDAVPVELDPASWDQLLTPQVLTTLAGMVLVASILTQGVKMLFLKNAEVSKIRIAAAVVALLVVIIAKLISSNPFEIADIVVLPGNALIVWFSSMKGYEQVVGLPGTPAGNTDIKNVH